MKRRSERQKPRTDLAALHRAFATAEAEREELTRLRAAHPRYSGLYFKRESTDHESEQPMSQTQDGIGIVESNNADYSGFDKPSTEDLNLSTGRVASAPLSGGDGRGSNRSPRGYAPGAPQPKRAEQLDGIPTQ